MSEQILKALMQLFAIISRPQSNRHDQRTLVENFLKRQLNSKIVQEYLKFFDDYHAKHQQKLSEVARSNKRTSSSSVRVLLICTEINEELTQKQKIFVLVQLLELIKSDIPAQETIAEQELQFITTVSDIFNIPLHEFELIRNFVLNTSDQLPDSNKIVSISSNNNYANSATRHFYSELLEGEVNVLQIASVNMFLIRYTGNGELYLNGQLLASDRIYVFTNGSSIRNPQIKPIYYSDVVAFFYDELQDSKLLFKVKDLEYKFKGGAIGLQKMNFTEESGKLVGIMGASGSGKSTLLSVLNGSKAPSSGYVYVNGINIHSEKHKIEGIIGYVSQDDLLIEELTVFENLYYNALLCFDDKTNNEVTDLVYDMLNNIGLCDIKDMKVGSPLNKKISGGQRKRLNIALELIREPSILFLDEPTSGLSSRDSENIMDLLKDLSLKGKLVFAVIHQPSSDIFKMFDKLLLLDTGGYLIYDGDPIESIIYFKSKIHHANWNESECHICGNVNPEQLFNIIESRVLDEYGKITLTRKITPKEWSLHFEKYVKAKHTLSSIQAEIPKASFKIPGFFKQFQVFVKRDILSKLANTQYLIINILEPPVLAIILSFLIRYFNVSYQSDYTFGSNSNLPVYIFMSVVIAIFIGLSVSAEEIIKDRKILNREAFLNLSWSGYLLSKITVLFIISTIQAFLFVLAGNSIIQIKGMFGVYWLVLFSSWAVANIVGLIISDSFKTVVTIYILIPFLVIPQIILSGVIVKYDRLNPAISNPQFVPFYGELITARWAYEALAVHQFAENDYEKLFYPYEKAMSMAEFKKNFWVKNLKNKVDYLTLQMNHPENSEKFNNNLKILANELQKENDVNPLLKFNDIEKLNNKQITSALLTKTNIYLSQLNKYYIKIYNKASDEKDSIVYDMEQTPELKEKLQYLKQHYYNEKLTEFVTNRNDVDRIVEFKGELFQKENPIYLDPEYPMVKAHFYAPRKMIFGYYIDTLWVNLMVIWGTIAIGYGFLYYRVIKKLLDKAEQFIEKLTGTNEIN
ncbi:MAG: ATP-binding cassette domain-containing protein [Bacteroidota bacterium]|nr:ATP-binding cassette domain-containing protein [Bacteroidota bacterium]